MPVFCPFRPIVLLICLLPVAGGLALAGDYESGVPGASRDYGKSLYVGDPVSAGSGVYTWTMNLLAEGGPMQLGFRLSYRSEIFRFNHGLNEAFWWYPYRSALSGLKRNGTYYATVWLDDAGMVSFTRDEAGDYHLTGPEFDTGGYIYTDNYPRFKYELQETDESLYLLDHATERVYIFTPFYRSTYNEQIYWRPAYIMDRSGNTLTFSYENEGDYIPAQISDGLGRSLTITYQNSFIQEIMDQCGRTVVLHWDPTAADNDDRPTLRGVTNALGDTTEFAYAGLVGYKNNLIQSITLPEGNIPYEQSYGQFTLYDMNTIRLDTQTDAYGNVTRLDYDNMAGVLHVLYPDLVTETYRHSSSHGLPAAVTDGTGATTAFDKSSAEALSGITDRAGAATLFQSHAATGRVAAVTDALGRTTTFTYRTQNQTFVNPDSQEEVDFQFHVLSRVDYPDGSWEAFTHDAQGNPAAWQDRGGALWTYAVNERGQITEIVTPEGGIFTYTYDGNGRLATAMDEETGLTTFQYDGCHRLTSIIHPDQSRVDITHDALDQITSVTDENGQTTTYTYDRNGNLASVIDPLGGLTQFTHDLMDRPVSMTDASGQTTVFTYDSRGRVAAVEDPTGGVAGLVYDERGWLTAVQADGHEWPRGYSPEGVVTSRSTPLGHQSLFTTDARGLVTTLEDPLGHRLVLERDEQGRIRAVTDPLDSTTAYEYDTAGRLQDVTLPDGAMAEYEYNPQGLLREITDPNGARWEFEYSAVGRATESVDPLNRESDYQYDERGRLAGVTMPDGASLQVTRDAAGNVTQLAASDGTVVPFTYNALSELTATRHLNLERDARQRVTDSRDGAIGFGAAWDAAGRLAAATYTNGAFAVEYAYDPQTGLLTGVSDTLTGTTITFTYDDDRRLTAATLPNGEQILYTWDAANRLTRIQSGHHVDLRYELNAAGRVTGFDVTAPVTGGDAVAEGWEQRAYDDAGQLTTAGYAHDDRGRQVNGPGTVYQWNGLSWLTDVGDTILDYNGLGDVRSRTAGGQTTRFHHNYALGRNPLVAEQDETSGEFGRYYVYTPGGRLLYAIDAAGGNAVSFYHADRTGNILALTDINGDWTDAYAYDPYGRLLRHEGSSDQPFTFGGAYGVRREGPGGMLYQMRGRYYDAGSGRFLSREPVWPQLADPRRLNPYQFATGDPVTRSDPSGRNAEILLQGILDNWSQQISEYIEYDMHTETFRRLATMPPIIWPNQTESFWKGWNLATPPDPEPCRQCVDEVAASLDGVQEDRDPTASPVQTSNTEGSQSSDVLKTVNAYSLGGSFATTPLSGEITHSPLMSKYYKKTKISNAVWKKTPLRKLKPCTKFDVWKTAKTGGRACTLVSGAISWYEVGTHFTKTPTEISSEVGDNSTSWNPITRASHELGYFIGGLIYD